MSEEMSWVVDKYRVRIIGDTCLAIETVDDQQKIIPPEDAHAVKQFIFFAMGNDAIRPALISEDEVAIYEAFEAFIDEHELDYDVSHMQTCEGCNREFRWDACEYCPLTRIESGQWICADCIKFLRST